MKMLNTTYNYNNALTLFIPYVFSVFNVNVIKINNILNIVDKDLQIFITVTDLNKLPNDIKNNTNKIFNCTFGDIREDI